MYRSSEASSRPFHRNWFRLILEGIWLIAAFTLPMSGVPFAQTWELVRHPPEMGPADMAVNSQDHVYEGEYSGVAVGNVVYRSTDNGYSWEMCGDGKSCQTGALVCNTWDDLFAGCFWSGGCHRSTSCSSWETINNGMGDQWITSFALNSDGVIFAGTVVTGIYRSTDNGDSWTQVNNGLIEYDIHSLAVNSYGDVFAGAAFGPIYRSTDNGDTWTALETGMSYTVRDLAINSDGHVFAGTAGGGVYRSTDNGDSWTQVNTGLTDAVVYTLVVKLNGVVYAGTDEGNVFRTADNGGTWTLISNGLPGKAVMCLAATATGHVFAGTSGRGGIYRLSCCQTRGNIDGDNGVNVADLTYLVEYLFQDGSAPPCEDDPDEYPEGDVNASGAINIADLTYLVDYLFRDGPSPPPCP